MALLPPRAVRAPLTATLVLGTLPGVVVGAVVRVEVLSGPTAFYSSSPPSSSARRLARRRPRADVGPHAPLPPQPRIVALALAVGVIGGIYGIGGGSLLAPILVAVGFTVAEVAPAALASTFLTSIVGVPPTRSSAFAQRLDRPGLGRRPGDGRRRAVGGYVGQASRRGCPSHSCAAASASSPWRSGCGTS